MVFLRHYAVNGGTDLLQRPLPDVLPGGVKNQLGVHGQLQPDAVLDFVFELLGVPAGEADDKAVGVKGFAAAPGGGAIHRMVGGGGEGAGVAVKIKVEGGIVHEALQRLDGGADGDFVADMSDLLVAVIVIRLGAVVEHEAIAGVNRAAEPRGNILRHIDIHVAEDVPKGHPRRAVDDEAHRAATIVLDQKDHRLMKGGVLKFRQRHEQARQLDGLNMTHRRVTFFGLFKTTSPKSSRRSARA